MRRVWQQKGIIFLLALSMLFFSTPFFSYAQPMLIDNTPSPQEVKIGYLADHGILSTPFIKGAEGYCYEYFQEIARYTGHRYTYELIEIKDAHQALLDGEIDLYAPATWTEEREELFDFVPHVFGEETICLFAKNDSSFYYQDYEAFDGKKVGLARGIVFEEQLDAYCEEHNILLEKVYFDHNNYADMLYHDDPEKRCDLVLGESLYPIDNIKIVDKIDKESFYFMARKDSELCKQIAYGTEQIELKSPHLAESLYLKYYEKYEKLSQGITREQMEVLKEKAVYTVGYHTEHHPLSYRNEDGLPDGFAVDVMNEIASQVGIKLSYIPLNEQSVGDHSDLDFNLSVIRGNSSSYGMLTEPYTMAPMVAIIPSDKRRSEIETIVTIDYDTLNVEDFLDSYKNAKIIRKQSMAECYALFENGEAECIIVSSQIANAILDSIGMEKYNIHALHFNLSIGITVSYDLGYEVFDVINNLVIGLDENSVEEKIIRSVSELEVPQDFLKILAQYRYEVIWIFLGIFLAVLLVFLVQAGKKRKGLRTLLEIDKLTGVMTKYKFNKEVKKRLAQAQPGDYVLSVLDIDNFKHINKTFGYYKGDEVIMAFAQAIRTLTDGDALICRDGKDTFFALCKATDKALKADKRTENSEYLQKALSVALEDRMPISYSQGVYNILDPNEAIDYMLDCANTARLQGKHIYGATIFVYSETMRKTQQEHDSIVASMEKAVQDKEFFVVLQPKYTIATEKIVGAEALVRWRKNDGETIYPSAFIPIFEANGFIAQLDLFVFEEVCRILQQEKLSPFVISVNISSKTAMQNPLARYLAILEKYDVKASSIEIEVTETAVTENFNKINQCMKAFKKHGFSIAVDDFGTGVSTLNRLKDMDVDVLKIDRSFLEKNLASSKGMPIVKHIIAMAKELDLSVVAEGVETLEQLEALRYLECEMAQGYYFHPPLTIDLFKEVLAENSAKEEQEYYNWEQLHSEYYSDIEQLPYGVMICDANKEAKIISANPAVYQIIGITKEELQKEYDNSFASLIWDKQFYQDIKKDILAGENKFDVEFRIRTKDGRFIWLRDIAKLDREKGVYYATLFDITHQKEMTQERTSIKGQRVQLEVTKHIPNDIDEIVYVADPETYELLYLNQPALDILDNPPESSWKGRKCYEVLQNKTEPCSFCTNHLLSDDCFYTWERYNEVTQKHYLLKDKWIYVDGKKMRMEIVKDKTKEVLLEKKLKEIEKLFRNG